MYIFLELYVSQLQLIFADKINKNLRIAEPTKFLRFLKNWTFKVEVCNLTSENFKFIID